MGQSIIISFKEGVNDFKHWAKQNNKYFGEWETDYPYWSDIYEKTQHLLSEVPSEQWNLELIHEFLYILSRDNEMEEILFHLINYPEIFIRVAEYAVDYNDVDARWQIAHGLGEVRGEQSLIEKRLNEFLKDENQYVRKRARFASDNRNHQV